MTQPGTHLLRALPHGALYNGNYILCKECNYFGLMQHDFDTIFYETIVMCPKCQTILGTFRTESGNARTEGANQQG